MQLNKKITLLVVDDEKKISKCIKNTINGGINVITTHTVKNAFNLIKENTPDVVLTDILLGNDNGFDILSVLKREYPDIYRVAMSGRNIEYAENLEKQYGNGLMQLFISKPLSKQDLEFLVKKINAFLL